MLIKKSYFFPLIISLFFLLLHTSSRAQEIPNDNENNNATVVDSIDLGENLLDSNEAYKKQFDSLSKDGEWIEMNKAEFVRAVSAETGEDLESEYPQTTEVIYIWRPYCSDNYWNPYSNGRWVFSGYGWVWQSYYDWGWGPYNYGRWYCSNLYGWTWIPGRCWAANWVTWRCNDQYVGWYPTCPNIFWRGHRNIYTNHLFAYAPINWIFVKKNDFTKKIDNTTIVNTKYNSDILKNSGKVKTTVYVDPGKPKFKYSGPDVNEISKQTGENITPEKVKVINRKDPKHIEGKNSPEYEKGKDISVNEKNVSTSRGDNGNRKNTKENNSSNTNTKDNKKTNKDQGTRTNKQKQKYVKRSYEGSHENNTVKTNTGSTESNSSKTNEESKGKSNETLKQDSEGSSSKENNNTKGINSPGTYK